MVTSLSSIVTSFVRKSAPIVALYWLLNFLFTYLRARGAEGGQAPARARAWGRAARGRLVTHWFIRLVLPTPLSPRMITFNSTFLPGIVRAGVRPQAAIRHERAGPWTVEIPQQASADQPAVRAMAAKRASGSRACAPLARRVCVAHG